MMMHKLAVESIGTFFLALTIGLVLVGPGSVSPLGAVAVAAVLVAMIEAGLPVSGAHYNPVVTLTIALLRPTRARDAAAYIAVQILGASVAALLVGLVAAAEIDAALTLDAGSIFFGEVLFTFALCWVIFRTALAPERGPGVTMPLTIGLIVLAGAVAVGPISSAAFNPAVSVALVVMGVVRAADLWLLIVSQAIGGLAAAGLFAAFRTRKTAASG